jgi:hypothetical protein
MRYTTFLKSTLSSLLIALSTAAQSQVMSAACSEPKGIRFDQIASEMKQDSDGFAGVNPQFVISANNPRRLTVIWPDTKSMGAAARQNTHEAVIIDSSPEMVTAVMLYEASVNMYTLFPQKGIVYMSTHRQLPFGSGIPNGALFYMLCKFEGKLQSTR